MTRQRKPLTRSQVAQLGGLAVAERMTAEQRSARARAGQAGLQAKFNNPAGLQAHMRRLAYGLPPAREKQS